MLNWKGPGTYHPSSKSFKRFLKIIVLVYIYQLTQFGGLMSCGLKGVFKNVPCLMYWYSSWHYRFGKFSDGSKYKNLNIYLNRTLLFHETKTFLTCASDGTFSEVIVLQQRQPSWKTLGMSTRNSQVHHECYASFLFRMWHHANKSTSYSFMLYC